MIFPFPVAISRSAAVPLDDPSPNYSNTGGSGDRRSVITVSTDVKGVK